MHQRSVSELQGVSPQRGVSTRRTIQDGGWWRSALRRGTGRRSLRPPTGAPLWAWLLLGALLLPGAWSFLSEEQEELLVELHNYYRGQVSPSASAMLPLKWDPSLKLIAEGYATKCIWNHNPELEDTGENLFAGTGSLDLRVAMEKWFLEHLDYDYQNNSCDDDKMCGHYTQMVWADTHRVGCAFHLCNNMEGLDWERVSFLVCNYYPAGNYEDERPYVEGDWCSRCPENVQKCENNLCVPDTEEEEEEDGDEEGTAVPSTDPSGPSVQPEEEKQEEQQEEEVVPPPATADVQPADVTPGVTAAPPQDQEDPAASPAPGTPPPGLPPTTAGPEEEEEKEEEEEEWRMESADKIEGARGRDVTGSKPRKEEAAMSAGSVRSASLLLAGLTGVLTLRL